MIVKNEEAVLARCLDGISAAVDEIIIVDTGSTDKTKEIAASYTDRIYGYAWHDNFADARNYAFSFANEEYIMWLDADDVVSEEDCAKIIALKKSISPDISAVYMRYHVGFDESGQPTLSYYRERMVKRSAKPFWVEPVHEVLTFSGGYIFSDIIIQHRKIKENPPQRNLKIFNKMRKNKAVFSPRLKYYYARELMYNQKYAQAITAFKAFLSDAKGWTENKIEAGRALAFCYEKTGQRARAYESLFCSFQYGVPCAETLCKIGELLLLDGRLAEAAYWYKEALSCPINEEKLSFVEKDYYGFIPYMQLCVIYDRLGKRELSAEYNERAGEIKPTHPSYLHNKRYFLSCEV